MIPIWLRRVPQPSPDFENVAPDYRCHVLSAALFRQQSGEKDLPVQADHGLWLERAAGVSRKQIDNCAFTRVNCG